MDWDIRDFNGYSTEKGTSYNAYLVVDDKVTLFDTVKAELHSDLMHRIHNLMDPKKIDYLVVNHLEMDHSGSLPQTVELIQPEKIFTSPNGAKAMAAHFPRQDRRLAHRSGQIRRHPVPWQAHRQLPGDPHAALAGQHVLLPAR